MHCRQSQSYGAMVASVVILALLPLLAEAATDKLKTAPPVTWQNPVVATFPSGFTVNGVEFFSDSTKVHFHLEKRLGYSFRFAEPTFALVGDVKYPCIGAGNVMLGQYSGMPESGEMDFSLIFKPFPSDTEEFSIIEDVEQGFAFRNIRNSEHVPARIADTYWRDDRSGNLLIGFADSIVFYDSKAWRMTDMKEKKGKWHVEMEKDGMRRAIDMDKLSGRVRKVRIDDGKPIAASYIGGNTMPDYPADSTGAGLTDTGYVECDSVKISGWIRGAAPGLSVIDVTAYVNNPLTDDQEVYSASVDSDGFFFLAIPVLNTISVYFGDLGLNDLVFEPGEYFIIVDQKEGKNIALGDKSRLANELLAHPVPKVKSKSYREVEVDNDSIAMDLLDFYRQADKDAHAKVDAVVSAHPDISEKYRAFCHGYVDAFTGSNMIKHKFYSPRRRLPASYYQYMDSLLRAIPSPVTVFDCYPYFAYNYLDQPKRINFTDLDMIKNVTLDLRDKYLRLDREGKITLTSEDRKNLDHKAEIASELYEILGKESTEGELSEYVSSVVDKFNADPVHDAINALYVRFKEQSDIYESDKFIREPMEVADSIGCDSPLRDFYLTHEIHKLQTSRQQPLDSSILALARREIRLQAALDFVERENAKYVALVNADYSKLKSIVMSPLEADQTDGEKIFRSLIEPHKGKIVLIDVWGTWCGPCRAALENSAEEFERLAPYDIVYMYLANNSEDKGWKAAILKYGLEGDNIVHYNLHSDQQKALETFLNVHSYPSYRIVDRDGDLLDVEVDARNLPALEQLVRQL